jgi:hypothetical protein
LGFKHKTRRTKGGSYPLPHLYETFGLVRLTRLRRDAPWAKREVLSESRMHGNPLSGSMPEAGVAYHAVSGTLI